MIFRRDELLQQYLDLFINRHDIWFRQWIDRNGKAQYCCMKPGEKYYEPVSLSLIEKHIDKEVTASWVALDEQGLSKWAAWDSDTENGALHKIEELLFSLNFHPLRESKRAGREGHLWLFLDSPVPAAMLIRFHQEILSIAGINKDAVEFFPKTATGLSQLRGPLGINSKPEAAGAIGWFEDAPQTISKQIKWLAAQPKNSSDLVRRMAEVLLKRDQEKILRLPQASRSDRKYVEGKNILELVTERRLVGTDWFAQCPLCAEEGHDKSRDNLRISKDGKAWTCVFGGPSKVHKAKDIIQFYG